MTTIVVRIEGAGIIQDRLGNPQFALEAVRRFLQRSTFAVEGAVKRRTPVDTGRLRASIHSTVEGLTGEVGSNVAYAPMVEFGTKPHFPPMGAIQPWARRHGFPAGNAGAFLVARAISRRGTRARRMFQDGLTEAMPAIQSYLSEAASEIEARWHSEQPGAGG